MVEISLDIPLLWLVLGITVAYVMANFTLHFVQRSVKYTTWWKENLLQSHTSQVVTIIPVVHRAIRFIQKVPSIYDSQTSSEDEDQLFCIAS